MFHFICIWGFLQNFMSFKSFHGLASQLRAKIAQLFNRHWLNQSLVHFLSIIMSYTLFFTDKFSFNDVVDDTRYAWRAAIIQWADIALRKVIKVCKINQVQNISEDKPRQGADRIFISVYELRDRWDEYLRCPVISTWLTTLIGEEPSAHFIKRWTSSRNAGRNSSSGNSSKLLNFSSSTTGLKQWYTRQY